MRPHYVVMRPHYKRMDMMRKKILQLDQKTGEVLEGIVAYIAPRRENGFTGGWMALALNIGEIVAQYRKELGEEGLAVLWMLTSKLDFENRLLLNQAEIGRKISMLRQNVQKAIKKLMVVGILLEGPKVGQNRSYQLNPEFGWRGSAENHKKALEKQRKQRMKAANITGVVKNQEKPTPTR